MNTKLPPKENRQKGWPKLCLESWRDSFERWKDKGEGKTLSRSAVEALHHTLSLNLQYIDELEREAQDET